MALTLFSRNGYYGTSMSDLAKALGLSKAALYKHFESKGEIRSCLFDSIQSYYDAHFGSMEHLPEIPESKEGLISLTMHMAQFTIHDERVVKVRRMLTIEQFHDVRACALATRHLLTEIEGIFAEIFKAMMDKNLLKRDDPSILALSYTEPISILIRLSDREPEREQEVLERIRAFAEHFLSVYGGTRP